MVQSRSVTIPPADSLDKHWNEVCADKVSSQGTPADNAARAWPDVMWETDADLRLISRRSLNDEALQDDLGDSLLGKTPMEVLRKDAANDLIVASHWDDLLARKPFRSFVHRATRQDGSVTWLEVNGDPVFSDEGAFIGYRGITRDITHRQNGDERIAFLAAHDPLTGLPNRTLFLRKLEAALAETKPGRHVAVLVLDLDSFKMVNDAMGHRVGDEVRRVTAERLSRCVRHTDTVGRIGGDEFAIVQVDLEKPSEAAIFLERLSEAIREPFEFRGQRLISTAAIGIALAPANGADPDQLLRNADIAQFRAKGSGRGNWCFYEPEMGIEVQQRRTLESELRDALANGQFELYYQPFYNIVSQMTCAFEALLRWRHPLRGIVLPDQFISIAEETGLIVPIGEWILMEACQEATKWPAHVSVAINLSPVQFRGSSPVKAVRKALEASGLPASRLELEITETVLMQDTEGSLEALQELRRLGCRISMDDFGTGYSSLSYLRSFPFDKIKIDRSFIRDLNCTPGGTAIVRAIATLGSSLQLATTAEGVETREQFSIVRDEGCTEVQGYLFSEPRPACDVPDLLTSIPDEVSFPIPDVAGQPKPGCDSAIQAEAPAQ